MNLKTHAAQFEFIQASKKYRTCAFFGGLQCGKTLAGADALRDLLYSSSSVRLPPQHEDSGVSPEVWILSKDYKLAHHAFSLFKWRARDYFIPPAECRSSGLMRDDANTHWLRPGADGVPICLRVRTASDPEALRSVGTLLVAWCDEIAHWPELAWHNLQGRGIVTPTRYLITTTPKGKNWLYREVYSKGNLLWKYGPVTEAVTNPDADPAIAVVQSRSVDNPWADKKYLQSLRLKFGKAYAEQELDASFVESVGMVYSFDRSTHMRNPPSQNPDDYVCVVGGVDPGYGSAYAAGIWGKTIDGAWYGLEELYRTKAITDDLVEWFKSKESRWNVRAWCVDKRRPSDYLLLKRHGIKAQANLESYGETERRTIMPMIRYCAGLMANGKLFISPSMEWHAESFEKYHFPDRDNLSSGENPVKYMDDTLDSMRYAICSVDSYLPDVPSRFGARRPSGFDKASRRVRLTADDYLRAQDAEHEKKIRLNNEWRPVR